ncbi:biliverdin-producing heme oxygenase [Acidiphilium acidophilum]|uniref:Biliverdin-producing heme oxygenase n=1 Tax=Acidiphilium acidophilum TaxID=76588 RepID=A0AAW9DRR1_ACIAO|nr:biliverdin-producing heme oxygenase [Acidiphilium acidophilum]MDX5931764.1 biliverdin-producing heme oxygenase [Acidiphilium acidophilum]
MAMGAGEAVARGMTPPEVDLVGELVSDVAGDLAGDLAGRLRQATWDLHREAERSGVVALMLSGGMGREAYGLFLRNLLAVYEALESGLDSARDHAAVGALAREELYRGAALRADLAALGGADWAARWPVLPEGRDYAARIAAVAACDPLRLLAHAYVRYLGDLNGGRLSNLMSGK